MADPQDRGPQRPGEKRQDYIDRMTTVPKPAPVPAQPAKPIETSPPPPSPLSPSAQKGLEEAQGRTAASRIPARASRPKPQPAKPTVLDPFHGDEAARSAAAERERAAAGEPPKAKKPPSFGNAN